MGCRTMQHAHVTEVSVYAWVTTGFTCQCLSYTRGQHPRSQRATDRAARRSRPRRHAIKSREAAQARIARGGDDERATRRQMSKRYSAAFTHYQTLLTGDYALSGTGAMCSPGAPGGARRTLRPRGQSLMGRSRPASPEWKYRALLGADAREPRRISSHSHDATSDTTSPSPPPRHGVRRAPTSLFTGQLDVPLGARRL